MRNDGRKSKAARAIEKSNDHGLIPRHFNVISYGIVAASALFYACLNPRYQTGFLNDDAIYVITAKDFWKTALRHPLLGIKADYPFPGLPLLLAPFSRMVSPHWTILEWLTVMATAFSVFLLAKWARQWLSPGETLVAISLYAFNRVVGQFSGVIMPGAYFTVGVIASFLLASQLLEMMSTRKALGLGVIVGWTSLLRPESSVLALTLSLGLLLTRKGRRIFFLLAIPLVLWGIFFLFWFESRQVDRTEFGGDISALLSFWPRHLPELFFFSFNLVRNFFMDTWTWVELLPHDVAGIFNVSVSIILGVCMIIGFADLWAKHKSERSILAAVGGFCGIYFLVHVFWHVAEARYLIPLVPFASFFFVRGGNKCLKLMGGQRMLSTGVIIALFIPYLYQMGRAVKISLWAPEALYSPPWRSLEWLRKNSASQSRVTSNIAPSVDLYAERSATGVLAIDNGDEFLYVLIKERVDYIVFRDLRSVTPGVGSTENPNVVFDLYRRWIGFYPERFQRVFYDPVEQTGIYKVVSPRGFREAYEKYIEASHQANAGRYLQAYQKTKECLDKSHELGCAYNLLGALSFLLNNLNEAEEAFHKAAKLAPDSSNVLLNLANLSHRRGQQELEADYLKRAKEISNASGNQTEFEQNYQTLMSLWSQGRSTLFFKSPHTGLYSQIEK